MKKHFVILLVGLMVSTRASAAMEVDDKVIHHMGIVSCGSWVTSRAQRGDLMLVNISWFVGYMSGIASGSNKNILNNVDGESITLWMDNYCKANPLEDTAEGGKALAIELMKRKNL